MSVETEKVWKDGFEAGVKEIKSSLDYELQKAENEELKAWLQAFISKFPSIIIK